MRSDLHVYFYGREGVQKKENYESLIFINNKSTVELHSFMSTQVKYYKYFMSGKVFFMIILTACSTRQTR